MGRHKSPGIDKIPLCVIKDCLKPGLKPLQGKAPSVKLCRNSLNGCAKAETDFKELQELPEEKLNVKFFRDKLRLSLFLAPFLDNYQST